jgi:hypothetical protein
LDLVGVVDMKKWTFVVGVCYLVFFLTSCSQTSNQSSKNVSSNNSTILSNLNKNSKLEGQDVSDIKKLATPDELVYLHDGVKTIYTKNSPKFKKIIQINEARQTKKLNALKLAIWAVFQDKNFASKGDILFYHYTNSNYAPIYFNLVPSPDEMFANCVANYYSSNGLPSYVKTDDPTKIDAFGHLAPADELLAYLKN